MNEIESTTDSESADGPRRRHPLARGIELITLMVDTDQDTFGVRELAGRLSVSPSTVHRLVADLEKLGLVSRTANGSYRLGLEFLRLAWTTSERYPVQEMSTETLVELTEQSGESSFFAVFSEQRLQMMFARVVESPHPLRYTLPQRQWLPLNTGASGLAILAFLPAELQHHIAEGPLHPATERTPVDSEALLARLASIRNDGHVITHGERIQGAIAIAAPVFGPAGVVVGSAGVTMPEARFNAAHASSLAGLVRQAASQISDYLSGTRDPQSGIRRR